MKKPLHIVGYVFLFLFSFVFFLYLTFPYEVLKETISSELSKATGYSIQIGELSPSLPLGAEAKKVKIIPSGDVPGIVIDEVSATVGIFSLLTGNLSAEVDLIQDEGGELVVEMAFPLFKLISGNISMPSDVGLEAENYAIEELVTFGLALSTNSGGMNPMLAPLLSELGLSGKLNGSIELELNSKNPSKSNGEINVRLAQGVIKLGGDSTGLTDQKLKKALVKADLREGNLIVDKTSGFMSDELKVGMNGKIVLKPVMLASKLEMDISLKLDKDLKEKYGFVIDMVAGGAARNGQVTWRVRGPMSRPSVTTF